MSDGYVLGRVGREQCECVHELSGRHVLDRGGCNQHQCLHQVSDRYVFVNRSLELLPLQFELHGMSR